MTVDAAPSGKAPPGLSRFGASTVALATAYPVAACGSHPRNNAGHAPAGPHSTHAGELFLDPGQDAETPGPGRHRFSGTGRRGRRGGTARVETWATKARSDASRRRMPHGHRTTQTPEERLT
jgi:hypothetical protein